MQARTLIIGVVVGSLLGALIVYVVDRRSDGMDISPLEEVVGQLNAQISSLQATIEDQSTDISTLQSQIESLLTGDRENPIWLVRVWCGLGPSRSGLRYDIYSTTIELHNPSEKSISIGWRQGARNGTDLVPAEYGYLALGCSTLTSGSVEIEADAFVQVVGLYTVQKDIPFGEDETIGLDVEYMCPINRPDLC